MHGFWFLQLIRQFGITTLPTLVCTDIIRNISGKNDCRLYYNVKQKKTFDEVITEKLSSMSYSDERVQYYNLLVGTDSGTMYGNHQTLQSLTGTSIHESIVTNGFGWDMQEWNIRHCSIDDLHEAVDIAVTSGGNIFAPFDCKIDSYDSDTKTVILWKNDVQYWYRRHRRNKA